MKTVTILVALFTLIAPLNPAVALAEEPLQDRQLDGFLYKDTDGRVWFGDILVSMGMIGTMGIPPMYRLSPELAAQLAPVINHVHPKQRPDPRDYYWFEMPRPVNEKDPLILVNLRASVRLIESKKLGVSEFTMTSRVYEIDTARLIHAEFITPEWQKAWRDMEGAIHKIIQATLAIPSPEKSAQLKAIAEGGAESIREMYRLMDASPWKERIGKLDPDAHVTNLDQRYKTLHWGSPLKQCIDRLGIQLDMPFPDLSLNCDLVTMLTKASSSEEFIATALKSCDEDLLCMQVIPIYTTQKMEIGGSQSWLSGYVHGWDIQHVSPERFEELRAEAQKQLDKQSNPRPTRTPTPVSATSTVDHLGIVVEDISPEEQVKFGFLRGVKVLQVLPKGRELGLQPGDVFPTAMSAYDLVMNTRTTYHYCDQDKRLLVIRGSKGLYVPLEK